MYVYVQALCADCGEVNEAELGEAIQVGSFLRRLCWKCPGALWVVSLVRWVREWSVDDNSDSA